MSIKTKKILRIIGLLIVILPSYLVLLLLFPLNNNSNENLYIKIIYGIPIFIGYFLYVLNLEKKSIGIIFIIVLSLLSIFISYSCLDGLDNMTNTGIDGIGEALVYVAGFRIGLYLTKIIAGIMLIIENRKFIFSKKFLSVFLIIALVIILIGAIYYLLCK